MTTSRRALTYAVLSLGLGWFNATVIDHWWPWPVFSVIAAVFLLMALDPGPVEATAKDRCQDVELQVLDEQGLPLTGWHQAELESMHPAATEGHWEFRFRAVARSICSGEAASFSVRFDGLTFVREVPMDERFWADEGDLSVITWGLHVSEIRVGACRLCGVTP